jgi:hypothetical protein
MNSNQEDVFNHEVAKRSVARAALHLGVERMSQEALDVLGDVLLEYLKKVGSTLSQIVESSNRTSAHTNVLDAIRAIDMCTSPAAVHQIHVAGETTSSSGVGWKDLASFLMGPDWMTQSFETVQPEAGGKLGPSSTRKKTKGWEAPYLDEIPPYPQASLSCANPHTLDPSQAQSLHGGEISLPSSESYAKELEKMPDTAFTTDWGVPEQEEVSKKKKAENDHEDAPPTKRVKLSDDGKEKAVEKKEISAVEKDSRPPYVPSFLPPFPRTGPGRVIAVSDENLVTFAKESATRLSKSTTKPSSELTDVRSSLVKMEPQSYWGSGWDVEPPTKVPAGRKPTSERDAKTHQEVRVAPLDKPSINRTSRIIEGSMDVSH